MPVLTIAFLTFNRQRFLEENLKRLIAEIKKFNLNEKVKIFIVDDQISDDALRLVEEY